jgi:TonB-dependent receptor
VNAAHAQRDHILLGRIIDAKTNEPLIGAAIQVENTSLGTVTDLNGSFRLENIRGNLINVKVSYLGYEATILPCDFGNDDTETITVRLNPTTTTLDEVRVLGQADGQSKAFLEQRVAVNIKNIVSSEQIEQFPDMNAAEVMQRIPGITVQRDQGEGRYVQLRGTPPELTNFNINGEQIPSPEGGVRYVGLDVISADQIDFIEVTKVLTPDMDADGIGGNVNIITKTPRDSIPRIAASAAWGYNNLVEKGNQQLQFSLGQRLRKFGYQISGSYYNNNQGSQNMEYDYSRGPILSQAQDTSSNGDNFYILYDDVELRNYIINRKRIGFSTNLDYQFNDRNTIYLRGMYNRFSDDERRYRISHGLSDANTLLDYRETSIHRDVRDRLEVQEIATIGLGGIHTIFLGGILDYELNYAVATQNIPNYFYVDFDQGGIDVHIDKTDPLWPKVVPIDHQDTLDAENLGAYGFDEITTYQAQVTDINKTAKINLKIPYLLGHRQGGYIKFGGKIRLKDKTQEREAQVYTQYFQRQPMPVTQTGPYLALTTVDGDFEELNHLGEDYQMTNLPDPDSMKAFFEAHPAHFRVNEQDTWEETYQEDYLAQENIYAAYLMFRHDISNLMILGGLRYEQTDLHYVAQDAWTDYEAGGVLAKAKKSDTRSKIFWLPQFQTKYTINQMTNIRAAATYTYSRPNFDDAIPFRRVSDNGDITKGNPTLDYPTSINFDLLAERFLPGNGILSGGFFYKKIDNFIFNYVRRAHEGENFNRYGLREITMAVNGIEAFVYGAEIQTQFKIPTHKNILKNFGIYSTYTFTESEAYISKRYPQNDKTAIFYFDEYRSDFFTDSDEKEVIPLPGQAKHTMNLALFYEGRKFYAKISGNYHSPFLDELGNDAGLDVYYDEALHVDFTANYQATRHLNLFVDIINLTDAPLRYYMGSKDYYKQLEYYSWWGRIGIKVNY